MKGEDAKHVFAILIGLVGLSTSLWTCEEQRQKAQAAKAQLEPNKVYETLSVKVEALDKSYLQLHTNQLETTAYLKGFMKAQGIEFDTRAPLAPIPSAKIAGAGIGVRVIRRAPVSAVPAPAKLPPPPEPKAAPKTPNLPSQEELLKE